MNSGTQQQQHERNSSAIEFRNQEQELMNPALTIKLQEFNNGDEGLDPEDEPRTPTSSDQKIPATTTCPPAPRKPKTVSIGNKRKTRSFQRISIDLRGIMNAMFVPDILAGDLGSKKANVTTGS